MPTTTERHIQLSQVSAVDGVAPTARDTFEDEAFAATEVMSDDAATAFEPHEAALVH